MTAAQYDFLNNLNTVLLDLSGRLARRALTLGKDVKVRVAKGDEFSIEYEVWIQIDYVNSNKEDGDVHSFCVPYYEDNNYLIDPESNDMGIVTFLEGRNPVFDRPVCYLFHDLIDHSMPAECTGYKQFLEIICSIDSIYAECILHDQRFYRLEKNNAGENLKTENGWTIFTI